MTAPPLDPTGLADSLAVEIAGYRALVTVLEAEREALRLADPDKLLTLTATKLEHVSALEHLASERAAAVAAAGCIDMGASLDAWLAGSPQADVVRAAWSMLQKCAREARRQNELNGRLMRHQQQHFNAAFSALLQAAGVPPIYGADGRPQHQAGARTLAAA